MKKNFLIVPACTDLNRGDQALVWESAFLLKDAFGPDINIDIVDYGNDDIDRERQSRQTKKFGFNVVRNIIENPKRNLRKSEVHSSKLNFIKASSLAILDFIKHSLLLLFPNKNIFKILFKNKEHLRSFESLLIADAIVVKGGGYLHTYGKLEDLYYLWFGLYYVILAKRLNKKVIMLPNSIGPITGFLNQYFFKYVMNKVDLLYVREKISLTYIESLGLKNVKFGFDLGYYAQKKEIPSGLKRIQRSDLYKSIGITVRPYRFPNSNNPNEKYKDYIESIASYCNQEKVGNKFYFIVQVQGPSAHETDLIAINDVVDLLDKDVSYEIIDDDYNYQELMSIYEQLDLVIGTRFHSVIFSQVVGTPALAIAYGGNKSRGIMRELELEKYVVDIEDVKALSLKQIVEMLKTNIHDYKNKLSQMESLIKRDRDAVISELKNI